MKILICLFIFPLLTIAQKKCGYVDGLQQGDCVFYFDNGKTKWEQQWKKGKLDGNYIAYFENGKQKAVGKYKKDKKVGEWIYYNENGTRSGIENWEGWKGNLYLNNNESIYYKNDKIESKGNFENDVQIGKWQYYYENGKLRVETIFENGQKEGAQNFYNENGTLEKTEIYKNGKLVK